MPRLKTNLIAYALHVLAWSLVLSGIVYGLMAFSIQHPARDKPGYAEIRAIAQEYSLSPRDVAKAVRPVPSRRFFLPAILVFQSISIGFTLGLFLLIRKGVARFTEP